MSLLNKAQIRKFILEYAERNKYHKFTRVAPGVYDLIESRIRDTCRAIVAGQPSSGQTIRAV